MPWTVAAQESASTVSLFWSAVIGGIGGVIGSAATSLVSWRALADTRKARQRSEEREAMETITSAVLPVWQVYRNRDVLTEPAPDGYETWPDYFHSALGTAEAAVLAFRSKELRDRLNDSMDLLIWGATGEQLLYETGTHPRFVAFLAQNDVLECLGANLRGDPLPSTAESWTEVTSHRRWQQEQERRAEQGE
ncbi:hypothetical protein [Streptomyces sp. NPDC127092]|uniref:hypothetical protein n=1 Tax=Streptomyces sp. NPDC127092 TaxID=3347135 RepID=UPI00365DB099